ncbi:MAG: formate--tetrahydrofolate ligase, partial [Rhodothermales bacterium]
AHGEGKTLTTIGLGQALRKLGKKGIITLREPSVGPVFGSKGGAAGGGFAQLLPMERVNLHFNGDIHAVGTAHNLLAAMLDNHIFQGNALQIDVSNRLWNRAIDMNDRALRQVIVGLGGQVNGTPRESGFVITAASEVMAILALAHSRNDLKRRLGEIVVGYNQEGQVVNAADLNAHKAMAVVLNEAVMPNLVQTMEHTPALVHAGPYASIAHGASSVISARIARKLAGYVVTECGFGSDLGAEKYFDILCRQADLWPEVVVLVATCRAIKHHGGVPPDRLETENWAFFEKGLANLAWHIQTLKKFGVRVIVALNRFPFDTRWELDRVAALCEELAVPYASHEAFARGGEGTLDLAAKTVALADSGTDVEPGFLYDLDQSIEEKIYKVATEIYGANGVYFEKRAQRNIKAFADLGYGYLPVCIAKTPLSLSDDPHAIGVPRDWMLTVTDVHLSAGAGFLVVMCGDMMLMPGLPEHPAAIDMDVDQNGWIEGLF